MTGMTEMTGVECPGMTRMTGMTRMIGSLG